MPSLPEGIVAFDYAPFSELFPRAAAVVHAGGIGTTGLAMHAGRPMLVVPHAHDQPDNAHRLARLGIARVLWPRRYTPARVAVNVYSRVSPGSMVRIGSSGASSPAWKSIE